MRNLVLLLALFTISCHSYREGSPQWYNKWYLERANPGDFEMRSIILEYWDRSYTDSMSHRCELQYPIFVRDTTSKINQTIRSVLSEYISGVEAASNLDSIFRAFAFTKVAIDAQEHRGESGWHYGQSIRTLSVNLLHQDERIVTLLINYSSGSTAVDHGFGDWRPFTINMRNGHLLNLDDVFFPDFRHKLDSIVVTRYRTSTRLELERMRSKLGFTWEDPPDTLGCVSDTFFVYPNNKYVLDPFWGVRDSIFRTNYTYHYDVEYEGYMWPEEMPVYLPIRELASIIPETSPLYHLIKK